MVTVVHGSNTETADLAGRTVAEVRAAYESVFNIPRDAVAKVNGQQVSEEYALREDEKLLFEKAYDKHAA